MAKELLQRAINSRDPELARAALEAAVRAGGDRLWVHRNVARIYREVFDDTARARKVLDELQPLTCLEWRLVAAAWAELGDRTRATACLERAAKNARTSSDLCTIAMGYRDVGFADEGRLMIDGANAVAHRALEYFTVASALDAFSDRDRGLAVLERGLEELTDPVELVTLAGAFASYNAEPERIAGTLKRGERRASTVEGWLALAQGYDQLTIEGDAARRCVAHASKLSISSDHERAIGVVKARVTKLELLDDDRPRLLPNQILRQGARSLGWERDAAKLLGWLRARLPRTSVDALTRPDQFFVNDDLRTLLEILRNGALPHPLPGYLDNLWEVARGEGPGTDPLTRAFACTIVCIEEATRVGTSAADAVQDELMIMLLASCIELGDGAVEAAIPFYAALADSYDVAPRGKAGRCHGLFAELALVLAAIWLDPTDPRIAPTIERLIRDEPVLRELCGFYDEAWLLGLGFAASPELWLAAAREILVRDHHRRLLDLLGTRV